jgi:hypothetical protein
VDYREKIWYPVEWDLPGYPVRNKEHLVSAISNALVNEHAGFEQLKKIPVDKSLETIGDFILDVVIIDNFAPKEQYTVRQTGARMNSSGNGDMDFLQKRPKKIPRNGERSQK